MLSDVPLLSSGRSSLPPACGCWTNSPPPREPVDGEMPSVTGCPRSPDEGAPELPPPPPAWPPGNPPVPIGGLDVRPASTDLYMPFPWYEERELLASTVPTYTTLVSLCETATVPMEITGWLSKIDVQVIPLFVVFQRPPKAAAA